MLKNLTENIDDFMYNYTLQQYAMWLYIVILLDVLKEGS